jgi:hypothetical protein
MTENVETDISMKKYLLGELAEPEQRDIEQRLMTSNEYFEELLVAEDELVDEYLNGTLSPHEREKFDNHFLCTPERQDKLRFARSLQRYVSIHAERPQKIWAWPLSLSFLRASYVIRGWSMATALLMMVVGGSWLSVRTQLIQHGIEQARKQQVAPAVRQEELRQQVAQLHERNDELTRELEQREKQSNALEQELAALKTPKSHQSAASVLAFALIPGGVRSVGQMNKVAIPPGVKWVQLELSLDMGDHMRYQVVLQNAQGEEIWSESAQRTRLREVSEGIALALPAGLLSRGYYVLKLSGVDTQGKLEGIETYRFSVEKK